MVDICNELELSQSQSTISGKIFLGHLKRGLENGNTLEKKRLLVENERLKRMIAEQALVIDTLKKLDMKSNMEISGE